jgi:hypothetical protein
MRWLCPLVVTFMLFPAVPACAQEEPDPEFFYPVVTRRPVINVRPLPGMTFRAGVELPVTPAREFDYAVHAGLVWEF